MLFGVAAEQKCTKPVIVEPHDGRLLTVTRADGAVLISSDRGVHWSRSPTGLCRDA